VSRPATVPPRLGFLPFRGTDAVASGLLTRRMLAGPTWRRLLPDVYVRADAFRADDHRMWCDAARLILPAGAAIGGRSAAFLWGVDLLSRENPVTVVAPRPTRMREHPGLVVKHTVLEPDDLTRFAAIPVTTPLRTAFDLGRWESRVDAVVAVDALLNRRLLKLDMLDACLQRRPGWPGTALLREVLSLAEPLSESPMETRLRLLLIDAGAPRPVAQHDVLDSRGRFLGRVDLAYPALRIALEYEGDHHRERAHFRQDVSRLNALRAAGWIVLRFTADDVLRRPKRVARDVAHAMRERGGQP
jgi:hypothetical protein